MLLKFSNSILFSLVLFFTSTLGFSQINSKASDAFEERDYQRAISILKKDYFSGNEEVAYYIGEAYRKTYDYARATEWHMRAISEGTQPGFYGYCMTLIQMGEAEKCLAYAKQKLLLNPNSKELPEIIETSRRHISPSRSSDSLIVFDDKTLDDLFPVMQRGNHKPENASSEVAPKYLISSIYSDESPDPRLIKQNRTSIPRFDEIREMNGIGFKYKKDKIGVYTLRDQRDVNYLVYSDYFEEYNHTAHYSDVESFIIKTIDGKIEEIEGSELFKDKRTVKFPAISADGTVLIFASKDMKGGYGGYDLYRMIYRSPFWSNPENLGPEINSAGDEIYPFISFDNKLYFSSNGNGGYGDHDIFSMDLELIGDESRF